MRALTAIMATAAMLTTGCASVVTVGRVTRTGPPARWENVIGLPAGAEIVVTLASGSTQMATFVQADADRLRVTTKDGPIAFPAAAVTRVRRVVIRPYNPVRRAAVGAAVWTGVATVATGFVCLALGGRWCWIPPTGRTLATSALMFGALGAVSSRGQFVTVYVRR